MIPNKVYVWRTKLRVGAVIITARLNTLIMKTTKKKKSKPVKFDGLNDSDKKNIRTALRQVWSWSYSRRLVVQRCLIDGGFSKCEKCKSKCAKVFVDHIKRIGEVDAGIISRMFVASKYLQGLCDKCHKEKTKQEKRDAAASLDFY